MAMTRGRDRTGEDARNFTVSNTIPRDFVAPNFQAWELTRSEIAQRSGIDNGFETDEQLQAAVYFAREVLQPVRDAFGAFFPNSVFRSQALERALKRKPSNWVSTSQHTMGMAGDIEVLGLTTLQLAKECRSRLRLFDQIICEKHDARQGPNSGWVHVSLVPPWVARPNRKQLLSLIYLREAGRWDYVPGLRATA